MTRVLVVDDDTTIRTLVRGVLSQGLEATAESALDAVDMLDGVDVVVSDC